MAPPPGLEPLADPASGWTASASRPGWRRVFTYASESGYLLEHPRFVRFERTDGAIVFEYVTPDQRPWLPQHRPWVAQRADGSWLSRPRPRRPDAPFRIPRRWKSPASAMAALDHEAPHA